MKKKTLEHSIRRSFTVLPHEPLSEDVYAACEANKTTSVQTIYTARPVPLWRWAAAAVAVLTVAVLGGMAVFHMTTAAGPMVVSLDVNPSIRIEVDEQEIIREVTPLNDDGAVIIGENDFTGDTVESTVNTLVNAMVEHGYLSEVANSLLISVDSENAARAVSLQSKLTDEVEAMLAGGDFEGGVMSQTLYSDEELASLARAHDISTGKAMLICRITELNPLKTFEQLAPLSINELNLLVEQLKTPEINTRGQASDKAYIGTDAALQAAVTHAGLTLSDITCKENELDHEDGVMCYEVDFVYNGTEYDYEIDALSGDVLKSKQKADDGEKSHSKKELLANAADYLDSATVKATVLTHAGVSETALTEYDIELDSKQGVVVYEVDFECGETEYDYTVDAVTGEILTHESEIDDEDDDDDDDTVPTGTYVDKATVKATVAAHVGVQESDLHDFDCELKTKNGAAVYEVEFETAAAEYEYIVDAVTGAVLDNREEIDD